MKYSFADDYSEGAHTHILELLAQTNLEQQPGYGDDAICIKAQGLIKNAIKNPHADVHFVSGGTQANIIALASMLKPYESVITAESAHINVHEAGAVETTGHKINALPAKDGKITAEQIQEFIDLHFPVHMAKPKVVSITYPTELGTLYTKAELKRISTVCKKNDLYFYLDGARLGVGLTSQESDLTLPEISELVDIFYIGGTKNGALLGEAIVINRKELQDNFKYYIKQHGALLAKGRILGAQFIGLFTDNLYFDLAKHANLMAMKLSKGISQAGYSFLTPSPTNQIFPIFPNKLIDKLKKEYLFYPWQKIDNNSTAIRLVTSWATKEEAVDEFLKDLQK